MQLEKKNITSHIEAIRKIYKLNNHVNYILVENIIIYGKYNKHDIVVDF